MTRDMEWLTGLQDFINVVGRNDDDAVKLTEKFFFTLTPEDCVTWLLSGLLAPRPAAIMLSRLWHSNRLEALDIGNPQHLIVPLFTASRDRAGDVLMARAGWEYYQALPDTITIFRGTSRFDARNNPSWTMNP